MLFSEDLVKSTKAPIAKVASVKEVEVEEPRKIIVITPAPVPRCNNFLHNFIKSKKSPKLRK